MFLQINHNYLESFDAASKKLHGLMLRFRHSKFIHILPFGNGLFDDQTILGELANVLPGVGIGNFVDFVGIQPDPDGLFDDQTILGDLANVLSGVGIGNFVDFVGIQPNFLFSTDHDDVFESNSAD